MLALFLALASPELDVRGISVSYGNTLVENAFRNAVVILRRAGKRTTLGVGARRPLKRALEVAAETHGESGVGYAEVPPAGVILDFVKSLDRMLADQPEPVTLVTLGPVTSLALALRRDQEMVRAKVAPDGDESTRLSASSLSGTVSPSTATCTTFEVSPAAKASVPDRAV
jgi:inosine-uridine nucleoside N-ribohydrolase